MTQVETKNENCKIKLKFFLSEELNNTKSLLKLFSRTFISIFFIMCGSCTVAAMPRIKAMGEHFSSGGKEFRICGVNQMSGMHLSEKEIENEATRLQFLNVNMVRMHSLTSRHWGETVNKTTFPLGLLPISGNTKSLVNKEAFIRYITALKKQGIYIAISIHGFRINPEDVGIIKGGDATEWKKAVVAVPKEVSFWLPVIDERSEAIKLRFLTNLSQLRYNDDHRKLFECNQIAMIETCNERLSYINCLQKDYLKHLPAYFRNKLDHKFIAYLKAKYCTTQALKKSWMTEGKKGLLPEESLEDGKIFYRPKREETKEFSSQRALDTIGFLVKLDLDYQRRVMVHLLSLGYKGMGIYSDFYSYGMNSEKFWLASDLLPYVEDHAYEGMQNLFRSARLVAAKVKIGSTIAGTPTRFDRPYWRSEARDSGGACKDLHWSRVANPLYYAVYNSLIGRDGVCFHGWVSHVELPRDWSVLHDGIFRAHDTSGDIPWQMVFRAANRLFTSAEIQPLPSVQSGGAAVIKKTSSAKTDTLATTSDVLHHSQVYRNHTEGILRVKTQNFMALAVDHPYEFKSDDLCFNISSDRCNVIISEKKQPDEYEVTAVGFSGETITLKQRYLNFKPLEYVKGKVIFRGREIACIEYLDPTGKVIHKTVAAGSSMTFIDGVWLYRVRLVPEKANEL